MKSFFKRNRTLIFAILSIVLLLGGSVSFLVISLSNYVQKSVHEERKVYLTAQMETSASLTEQVINKYQNYSSAVSDIVATYAQEGEDVFTFIDSIQNKLYLKETRLILVDENCTWYGKESGYGRITSVSQYSSSTSDNLFYMTIGVDNDIESLVFRQRLDEPINFMYKNSIVEIKYCSIICDMDDFYEQLDKAFPYKSNRFIVDDNGLMLYKEFNLGLLMSGTNIFTKYEQVNFLYDDKNQNEKILTDIRNGNTCVNEFGLANETFFICTKKLNVDNNWYISYVVNSSTLSSGNYVKNMLIYVFLIVLILFIAVFSVIVLFIRNSLNKRKLTIEQEANVLLEKASNAKGIFLSNMSHDIRTPINGIMGMTMLAKKEKDETKRKEYLNNIEASSNHLLSLVNDVLDMASIESGKIKFDQKETNLNEIVDTCNAIIGGYLANRKLTYDREIDEIKNPFVLTDGAKLKDILINLLSNSVKYTKDGGKITFRSKVVLEDERTVKMRFEIEDTGVGMSEEFLSHIFEPFAQENNSARTEYKGTGLGMSIVKKYIDLFDGAINVESELNKGSKFIVNIAFEKVTHEDNGHGGSSSIKGCHILLVEDNEVNIVIAEELLKGEGAVIDKAYNGKEAIERFIKTSPFTYDVILMDIMMPVLDGMEATKTIRQLNRDDALSIPIIAMTAKTMPDDIKEMIGCGMTDYLSKPIVIDKVIETIGKYYEKGEIDYEK